MAPENMFSLTLKEFINARNRIIKQEYHRRKKQGQKAEVLFIVLGKTYKMSAKRVQGIVYGH